LEPVLAFSTVVLNCHMDWSKSFWGS